MNRKLCACAVMVWSRAFVESITFRSNDNAVFNGGSDECATWDRRRIIEVNG
jgi:hypothetical protein